MLVVLLLEQQLQLALTLYREMLEQHHYTVQVVIHVQQVQLVHINRLVLQAHTTPLEVQHLLAQLVQQAHIAFKECRQLVNQECIAMLPHHQASINNVQSELIQPQVTLAQLVLLVELVLHVYNQECLLPQHIIAQRDIFVLLEQQAPLL